MILFKFFHNGKALCRPVLHLFKQSWAYNAKISKWRKVEASIIEICSSESEPKWSEVSRSNILLFVAVIFLPVAVATIQALPKANYSEV